MEFIKSKMYGGEVTAVFTGPRYFFFSEWYGLFAVAERDEEREGNGRSFLRYTFQTEKRAAELPRSSQALLLR